MIYLGSIILFYALIQLLVALINLIFPQTLKNSKITEKPLVSILIPARNEEKNIENILNDLQNISYKNIEILIFNDQSTDNTESIVNIYLQKDTRIKLINSNGLALGWTGKNYACYSLAHQAKGEYYLFLDADVRISELIIEKSLNHLLKYNLALLSIFPIQTMKSSGEWKVVPLMNYILLSLLPLILVRISNFRSISAANGQFMLFERQAYKYLNPHEKMKNSRVEDIQIARLFKKYKFKIACIAADSNVSCQMYTNYQEAETGFIKNMIYFFGNSYLWAGIFWLLTSFGWLLFFFSWKLFFIYLVLTLLTRILISKISKQNVLKNLLYMVPQQISMAKILYKSWNCKNKKEIIWKGRNVF